MSTTGASSKTAAPHRSAKLFASIGKVGVRSALQWGLILITLVGVTGCDGCSLLLAVQPHLHPYKGDAKTCKGDMKHVHSPPVSSRPVLHHEESNCLKWDVDYQSWEALIKPIHHPPVRHVSYWAWQTWFMPPALSRAYIWKGLNLLVLHSHQGSAFLWSSFRSGPFATVEACKWAFVRVNRIRNGLKNGSLATDVDSKALKGSLCHCRDVCEILRTTSSHYHRGVTVLLFNRGILGWLTHISDMH